MIKLKISFLILLLISGLTANANILLGTTSSPAMHGKCGPHLTWAMDKAVNLVISGEGPMDNYGSDDSPWRNDLVRTVEVSDGVATIGRNAFSKSHISVVVLPSTITSIGDNAFKNCRSLASVTLPYGLQMIGKDAFSGCVMLPKVLIPASVQMIGDCAFEGCKYLTEVSIPSRVKSVGRNAFKKCNNLTQLNEIPDFITENNASLYGLSRYVVGKYYDGFAEAQTEKASTSQSQPAEPVVEKSVKRVTNAPAYGESDVDKPLQAKPQNNRNTFAFIFSNENYTSLSDVPFAHNDGNSFAKYCTSILGLPDQNVNLYKDATSGTMKGAISYLKDIDDAYNGDIDVIVYYAGHGAPSDDTKEAFLIPVDAAKVNRDYCYALDDLYAQLSGLKANSVKVFLDACFSGPSRDNAMVEQARKVAVVPKKANLKGNLVVMSAASDEQTAWQYDAEGHGLFTYYLLKKLRETGGDVTLGELTDYISTHVGQTSVVVNRKRQTPTVAVSPVIGSRWKNWTIK